MKLKDLQGMFPYDKCVISICKNGDVQEEIEQEECGAYMNEDVASIWILDVDTICISVEI